VIAAVISARGRHTELPPPNWNKASTPKSRASCRTCRAPESVQTITEKRATFACLPNLQRPPAAPACPASGWPATMSPATIRRRWKARSGAASRPRRQILALS
jgi:hypothetical protein